jgi:pSer/pThr/pTyr-binding forkhead associated (FHA) protein
MMNIFLNTCGIADSLQLVVESPNLKEPELRLLHQPFAVIGRDPRADVLLDHAEVSRRHVYLQMIGGRAFWIDLESRTGSRDEKKSQKFGWMEGAHTLWVGPYVIRRLAHDGADSRDDGHPRDTPLIAQAYGQEPLPEVALEFLNGPSQSMSWPVNRVMSLIGSASGCKFRLTDPSVSRFHGSLLRTPAGVWIVDLLGKGGITVDEVPVRSHRLTDGEVLGIGRYQLRIRYRPRAQGSRNGSSELGRSTLVARQSRQDHAPNTLKFPDWAASALAFEAGPEVAKRAQFPLPAKPVLSFPNIEIMSSDGGFPFQPGQSGLTESILVPLVNQFGLMQQQMFDQFQQAMAMMVQMFGTMHRDQMEVIRAELDRLHELTDEFHALKEELANRSREQAPTVSGEPSGDHRAAAVVSSVSPQRPAVTTQGPANRPGIARLEPASVAPPQPPPGVQGVKPVLEPRLSPTPTVSSPIPTVSSPTPTVSSPIPTMPSPTPTVAPNSSEPNPNPAPDPDSQPKSGAASRPAGGSDRDTMVWLHQRIMTLQAERESRWQKILKLLPGVS